MKKVDQRGQIIVKNSQKLIRSTLFEWLKEVFCKKWSA